MTAEIPPSAPAASPDAAPAAAIPPPAPVTDAPPISALLRTPDALLCRIAADRRLLPLALLFLLVTVLGSALYGLAAGFFVDWHVALLDAAKTAGISLFAFLLCLPSLYVFTSLTGTSLSLRAIVTLGLACSATLALLLGALAPILWLFAVSTTSVAFVTFLCFILLLIAAIFAIRPVDRARKLGFVGGTLALRVWLILLVIVALQTATLLRPMLAPRGTPPSPEGKCFFLSHFISTFPDSF
ncbi:MAG: hypothetical protein IJT88_05260 [Kiritimatiellae bacterium]|nr:hypothetical protein [Kiritimatiellia bacterium]MBQ9344604.1 hypothetical protein [Kiritimatiellia bacterium]